MKTFAPATPERGAPQLLRKQVSMQRIAPAATVPACSAVAAPAQVG